MSETNNSTRTLQKSSNAQQLIDSWVNELYDDSKHRESQTDSTICVTQQSAVNINESGGPRGKEPTRYGDWEKAGRCIDF